MKVALCQINSTLGNFDYNSSLILKFYKRSKKLNADIVVFPELSITGYPPQDLLLNDNFINENLVALTTISKLSTVPIIIGFVNKIDNLIYNSAGICYDGKLRHICNKVLLPTYDVFDEARYFKSGKEPCVFPTPIGRKLVKIGLQICEDMWDMDYDVKVSKSQMQLGADLLINISASPYQKDRLKTRKEIIKEKVRETKLPFFYCNMVGAQDELIFDGQSVAYSSEGNLIGSGKSFQEDILIINSDSKVSLINKIMKNEESIYRALCLGVRDYFIKTGQKEAVIGLSGGIDSSLVASIAVEALGFENVHGIAMPSVYSSKHSLNDAEELAKNLNIDYRVIPIQNGVNSITQTLKPVFKDRPIDVTEENIQSRIRGLILMALSNKFGWMVLSTGNKTELALGYCTLYGDMSGGLSVISDLNKIEVYRLAEWINEKMGPRIPINSINKMPSAELAKDQFDPFDYEIISPLVDRVVETHPSKKELVEQGFNKESVDLVKDKIQMNEYKRKQAAPGLKISSKAFGMGRRYPIVNHYMD